MELWKLQHTPMCLPALEVKEVAKEAKEDSGHPEIIMEDVAAQSDAFEEQQFAISENQLSAGTSSGVIPEVLMKTINVMQAESALAKENLDR